METGTVKAWFADRGFGFVSTPGGRDYFMHIKNWLGSKGAPEVGRKITFEIGPTRDNRQQAIEGRYLAEHIETNTTEEGMAYSVKTVRS
jgi:cold shock CspA family protein